MHGEIVISRRNIALVAHDNKKYGLVEWIDFNKETLALHNLYATGETGKKIIEKTSLEINLLKGGPFGGGYGTQLFDR